MEMGKRKAERQQDLFVPADKLQSAGHSFCRKVNKLLAEAGFDAFVEAACRPFYKDAKVGRPSLASGVYFRMLFVGYFEGIDSQRGRSLIEIAEEFDVPVGTVKRRLHTARRRLQGSLDGSGFQNADERPRKELKRQREFALAD